MYILAFTLLTLTFIPKMSGWKLNVSALFSDAVSLYYYLLYFLSFFYCLWLPFIISQFLCNKVTCYFYSVLTMIEFFKAICTLGQSGSFVNIVVFCSHLLISSSFVCLCCTEK